VGGLASPTRGPENRGCRTARHWPAKEVTTTVHSSGQPVGHHNRQQPQESRGTWRTESWSGGVSFVCRSPYEPRYFHSSSWFSYGPK
jgi:hypothetical protein